MGGIRKNLCESPSGSSQVEDGGGDAQRLEQDWVRDLERNMEEEEARRTRERGNPIAYDAQGMKRVETAPTIIQERKKMKERGCCPSCNPRSPSMMSDLRMCVTSTSWVG
jgi:hypothetical protein